MAVAVYYFGFGGYRLTVVWDMGYEMAHAAASLASGNGFSSPFQQPTGPTAAVPPGYPALLSVIFRVFGTMTPASAMVAVGLNLVFSAATGLVIFHLAKKTVGENAGVIGAWVWALYPPVILSSTFHVWDTSLTILLAAVGCLVASYLETGGWKMWLLHGALWGTGALVNPSLLTIYGVLLAWACWRQQRRRTAWRRNAVVAAMVLIAIMGPWAARNYRLFHRLVPVRSNYGLELWVGNHEGADGFFRVLLHPLGNTAEMHQYRQRGEGEYMAWKQHLAVVFIEQHPAEFLRLTRFRMGCFWGGVYDSGYAAIVLPTTLMGLLGLLLLARHDRELMWLYALPLVFYPIPYYLTHADLRFRLPAEPLLACLAGYAVTMMAAEARRRITAWATPTAAQDSPSTATVFVK
ncbi:MAG: glycosyltransferase family 39 protein [Acidobacteriia bacterium]|nr:glycosyltransferase family 39 protein [Terriglobia bacterium]